MDTGGYGVGSLEILRLWVPPLDWSKAHDIDLKKKQKSQDLNKSTTFVLETSVFYNFQIISINSSKIFPKIFLPFFF